MRVGRDVSWWRDAAAWAGCLLPALACAAPWSGAEEAVRAMREGRCEAAVDGVNRGLQDRDAQAFFVVGLMYLKGLCIASAPERAQAYLEPAAKAGHQEAAYMLALMYGLGTGVPQNYAQAGRWTIALMDIARAKAGRAGAPVAESASEPGRLDASLAASYGVIGTAAALVRDRLLYPEGRARLQSDRVDLRLTLTLDADGIRYSLSDAEGSISSDMRSSVLRRSTTPYLEAMQETVEAAIRALPPFEPPAQALSVSIPYKFNVR